MSSFRFGEFLLDASSRELSRDGDAVTVEPKVFDLIVFLLNNRDRAVSKDELQDNVWAGTIVTEASVSRCVMKARKIVDAADSADSAIRTIQRHGYRWVAPVEETGVQRPVPVADSDVPAVAVCHFQI